MELGEGKKQNCLTSGVELLTPVLEDVSLEE